MDEVEESVIRHFLAVFDRTPVAEAVPATR
jgi:hypothetical protein